MKQILLFLTFIFFFTACGSQMSHTNLQTNSADLNQNIYYGDIQNNTIINIDIKKMQVVQTIQSNGIYPYEVVNGYDDELLVLNRKDTNVGVIDGDSTKSKKELDFSPRSIALNSEQKLTLLSSSSQPAETMLKENALTYSDSTYKTPESFGGENATGHPVWVNDSFFLLLDRTESTIELYEVGNPKPITKLSTSSSVHHLVKNGEYYYGSLEGIQGKASPGIIKFKIAYAKFTEVKEQLISAFSTLPNDFKKETWGFHHFAIHPDKKHLYVGSYEGNVFVLDTQDLSLTDTFKAGIGAGHFLFYHDTLIVTNHYDTFKSFYDASNPANNKHLKNLSFSTQKLKGKILQSHTSHIVDDFLYFTFNTKTESRFYKVDLKDFSVANMLVLPSSYCVMGALKSRVNSAFSDM